MKSEKCYTCEKGELIKKKTDFSMYGVNLGRFQAEVCNKCGEIFFDEKTSDEIDGIAKKKGLWGLDAHTKVNRVGTSMAITINKKIADFVNLKKGEEILIHPENKRRIIIELPEKAKT